MEPTLREVVEHHRKIIAGHGHAVARVPLESTVIVLLAGIHDALVTPAQTAELASATEQQEDGPKP